MGWTTSIIRSAHSVVRAALPDLFGDKRPYLRGSLRGLRGPRGVGTIAEPVLACVKDAPPSRCWVFRRNCVW